jgi:hypothetical protein
VDRLFIRTDVGLMPTPDEEVMILRLPRTPPLDLAVPLFRRVARGRGVVKPAWVKLAAPDPQYSGPMQSAV